jgi:PmbA protein
LSFFDLVETEVREFGVDGIRAEGYRLAMAEAARSELGVESNRAGSPYRPLTVTGLSGGRFVIQWSDGLVSRGSLSRAPRDAVREAIASSFEGRYEDPDAAIFAGPTELPDIPLESAETAAVADGRRPEVLPGILDVLAAKRDEHGAKMLDGSARASRVRRRVVTSGGFRGETVTTRFGWTFALDSLVWDGHESREVPSAAVVATDAERTAADFRALSRTVDESPRGETTVILHPRVAESFLDAYVFSNLSGAAVANGRSRFTAEDFRAGRRAFREDFTLSVRPHESMSVGAFRFTDEGVASREFDLVEGGRLTTPTLDLKYGKRLSLPPAPLPGSVEGLAFRLDSEVDRDGALAAGSPRVLVHSVLGLHTQDTVRGEYSVLAPQGVLYRDGEALGRVTSTLNGSFFENLTSEALRLVRFPGFSCPGLLFTAVLS